MTTVIAAVDDSPGASDALALAGRLSHAFGARRVRRASIEHGDAADGLARLARREDAALIVVGSSRVGRAGRVLPGSTGERLLQRAPCPVAIAPRGYGDHVRPLQVVGAAYDGSDESRDALALATGMARSAGGELRVIRVVDSLFERPPDEPPSYLERLAADDLERAVAGLPRDVRASSLLLSGHPAREVAARSGGLDVLVTGSRRCGPLQAVLVGAFTGRLLREVACPVVVLPRGARAPSHVLLAAAAASPALHQSVEDLLDRLARVQAGAVTLRHAGQDVRGDSDASSLVPVLEDIERDLLMAADQAADLLRRAGS